MAAERRRRTETDRLQAVVELLPDAVVVAGMDGSIRYANPAAEHLFGRPAGDLIGSDLGFPVLLGGLAEIEIVRPGGRLVTADLRVAETEWEHERVRLLTLRDATDRKRAEQRSAQLERERLARAEAEAASVAKSGFLAIMSHELRTPINAVIGYADLLNLGIAGPLNPDQRSKVTRILESARHLLGLVNEVLDLSRADARELTVQRRVVRLAPTVDGALAVAQPLADARGIALRGVCADGTAAYLGDPDRVRQILVHLLDNAVKFTLPGGRVTAECECDVTPAREAHLGDHARWVCARVVDTGIGIAPESLSSIFDPFVQVQSGHTRPSDGSGLGLTVSRRFARLMGGDITVSSEPGAGSTFTLWLPAANAGQSVASEIRPSALLAEQLHGLCEIGATLNAAIPRMLEALVARIRAEELIPGADAIRSAQLADHIATWIADVASTIAAIEELRGEPSRLVTDGSDIQLFVAERHGAQRAGLGCTTEGLEREWAILREELERVVRGVRVHDTVIAEAVGVMDRFIESGRAASVRALLRARQ